MLPIITDGNFIQQQAADKLDENDAFRSYLQKIDGEVLDATVQAINNEVTPQIDCTQCGACCRQLMINVTAAENIAIAEHVNMAPALFKEKYLEEGMQGNMVMNSIPCHFLCDNKCTVYTNRFAECRDFPHLHEPNFKGRLFGSLIHYAMCPIVYNVIERLKVATKFIEAVG